jgi:hypothetical protein
LEVWKVADGMHQPRRISAVLCEASRNVSSKRSHVFVEQGLASDTVEAGKTGLHRISYNTVADGNVLDIRADGSDGACCFVSCSCSAPRPHKLGYGWSEPGINGHCQRH